MTQLTLEQEAARLRAIKQAAKKVEKENAERVVQRRRDAESEKDLRGMGIDLRDLEGLV